MIHFSEDTLDSLHDELRDNRNNEESNDSDDSEDSYDEDYEDIKIDKGLIKKAEKGCNFYSIYKKYYNDYLIKYRVAFKKYMDMNINEGLWSLNQSERESLNHKWMMEHYSKIYKNYQECFDMYKTLTKESEKLEIDKEAALLKGTKMIGMTVTGAARLIDMINELGVEVIVIEEAGEVLEAHTLALLCESLKHLILIGDHKQLRPSVVNFNLENKYHLTRSLFERLVLNGVDKVTLSTQRRMRPEISDLIRCDSLYPDLQDHENTLKRNNIRGLVYNVYFFNHSVLEPEVHSKSDENHSKVNEYECKMIVHFVKYLLQVKYNPDQITILSFYLGQCQLINEECNNLLGKETTRKIRIIAVDNFQGEENDIIIFSAVRSNLNNRIGFCRVENRVNVALSRARDGLFMFGNMNCLIKGSHNRSVFPETNLWDYINETLLKKNMIGNSLPLVCPNHEDRFYSIEKPEDFAKYCPNGTCGQICQRRMKCGHSCKIECHFDECEKHCKEQCPEELPCGHHCRGKCYQCRNGHAKCIEWCNKLLPCFHQCPRRCYEECIKNCMKLVDVVLPCGHEKQIYCCERNNLDGVICEEACNITMKCSHKCKGNCCQCRNGHIPCSEPCERLLPCSHKCLNKCGEECTKNCMEMIDVILPCNHKNTIHCYEKFDLNNVKCNTLIEMQLPCHHTTTICCYERGSKSVNECKQPCGKKLECGHICKGTCYKCRNGHVDCKEIIPEKLKCGHYREIECYKYRIENVELTELISNMSYRCEEPCNKQLPCGHYCKGKCYECGNGHIKCIEACERLLQCGHKCSRKCYELCNCVCMEMIDVILPCGHNKTIHCYEKSDLNKIKCEEDCNRRMNCNHKCKGKCYQCKYGHIPCLEPCERLLPCGHKCQKKCNEKCTAELCKNRIRINLPCGHKKKIQCYQQYILSNVQCRKKVYIRLKCGHEAEVECYRKNRIDRNNNKCKKLVTIEDPCGHWNKVKCCDKEDPDRLCNVKIKYTFPCGHSRNIMCYQKDDGITRCLICYDQLEI